MTAVAPPAAAAPPSQPLRALAWMGGAIASVVAMAVAGRAIHVAVFAGAALISPAT